MSYQQGSACALTCSPEKQQVVDQLRRNLFVALRNRWIKWKSGSTVHMTLFSDREHHLPMTPLYEPLSWTADGFSLLFSHKGMAHHELVRSWPANP